MLRVHLGEVRSIFGRPPISDVTTPHGRFLAWHDGIPLEVERLRRGDARSGGVGASINVMPLGGFDPRRYLISVYDHRKSPPDRRGKIAAARPDRPLDAEPVAELIRRHVLAFRHRRFDDVEELMADADGAIWRVAPGEVPRRVSPGSPPDLEVAALIDAYQMLKTGRVTRYGSSGV